MATHGERAFQIWPLLVFAAQNRRLMTYREVGKCTGMVARGLGPCLEPIQAYCQKNGLPPLTLLVVHSTEEGLPGIGFSVLKIETAEDFAAGLRRVFEFDWTKWKPTIESFAGK